MNDLLYYKRSIEDYQIKFDETLKAEIQSGRHDAALLEYAKEKFFAAVCFIAACNINRKAIYTDGDSGYDLILTDIDLEFAVGKYAKVVERSLLRYDYSLEDLIEHDLKLYDGIVKIELVKRSTDYLDDWYYGVSIDANFDYKFIAVELERVLKANFYDIIEYMTKTMFYEDMSYDDSFYDDVYSENFDENFDELTDEDRQRAFVLYKKYLNGED